MGTRGLTGLIIDGTEKIAYQQYDSYPDGVGVQVLAFARTLTEKDGDTLDEARVKARAIVLVPEDGEPTDEQRGQLKAYYENVSTGRDWYSQLREAQGKLDSYLEAGFMPNHGGALARESDDVWLEYSYIMDLDKGEFSAYDGNLMARKVGTWKLNELPTDEAFVAAFG